MEDATSSPLPSLLETSTEDAPTPQGSGEVVDHSPTYTSAETHYQEIFKNPHDIAMTKEQQDAAIREALHNDDTMPREQELKDAIGKLIGLVLPRDEARQHAAQRLLDFYATDGCPTDCGPDWTKSHIEAAILKGPHSSAHDPEALKALHLETTDKVTNGYAKVIRYGDIAENLPAKLKISPVAMIPHKSRAFRTILDLSFRLRHQGKLMESVNSATVKQAPAESMVQLGHCVQRLIATLADNYDPHKPFKFAKLDIKDGFWRMAVNNKDAWNFCYVLPQAEPLTHINDALLVVPNCLQMGWCESPPFFCAASETARDVIETLLLESSLPAHPFEDQMLREAQASTLAWRIQASASFINLVEVFVDDFIGATNNIDAAHLEHFSRAMLFGVHSVFPPPEVTGHHGEDPISQKKLKQGEGTWSTTKEILGWLVDGLNYTLSLLPEKCDKITKLIKKICKRQHVSLLKFQELAGNLQHASFGIPGGKGLFSPIFRALKTTTGTVRITEDLKCVLRDWRTVIQQLQTAPTPVQLLVSSYPNYIQFTDACGLGAGGIITPGLDPMQHWVWKFEWPRDIKEALVSGTNKTGTLTINDLELAGLVLGWLVLEHVCDDLRYKHVGMFCDNTSAVSWAYRGSTSTSTVAGRLLRFLALRQRKRQVSSLAPLHVAGDDNAMADIPSRAFKSGKYFAACNDIVAYFNTHFPLPQNLSWKEYEVKPKLASRVTSSLRGERLQMESLLNLSKQGTNTGDTGQRTAPPATQTHTSQTSPPAKGRLSSQPLPPGYGPGLTVSEIKSAFKRSHRRSRPSPRPANWLDNRVPSSKKRANTLYR